MTSERMAEGYEPRFDIDAEVGHQGEMFVVDIISALQHGSCEVKTDERASLTGNLYVEYECKTRTGWQPSGIATTSAEVWAFVVGPLALCIPVAVLKDIARHYHRQGNRAECIRGSHPTKGVLVPWRHLLLRVRQAEAA